MMKFKSETTVRRYMKELQEVIDSDDLVASRLAYFALHAIRRVVEDVKGWPPLSDDAHDTARLIRDEIHAESQKAVTELKRANVA